MHKTHITREISQAMAPKGILCFPDLPLPLESASNSLFLYKTNANPPESDNARTYNLQLWLLHSRVISIPIIDHSAITVFAYPDSFSFWLSGIDTRIDDARITTPLEHDQTKEITDLRITSTYASPSRRKSFLPTHRTHDCCWPA